jgi:hypothetical protein
MSEHSGGPYLPQRGRSSYSLLAEYCLDIVSMLAALRSFLSYGWVALVRRRMGDLVAGRERALRGPQGCQLLAAA